MSTTTQIVLIAHNLRSTHNVGSLLRTADGLGVKTVYLTGYSPYPQHRDDSRLPHLTQKITQQIHKTALGAESTTPWRHYEKIGEVFNSLHQRDYSIVALEQTSDAVILANFMPGPKVAILVGREVEGLESDVIKLVDAVVEIPMFGQKESFNVTQAAAMAIYHCRFFNQP